jgi:hypothetical protein
VLERDLGVPMDAGLVLWITAAVFFRAFGTGDLPSSPTTPYQSLWRYDHVTHALSASIVAAVGYASARAVDVYCEDVSLPSRFAFAFVLLFVLAFGVFWEVIEFVVVVLGTLLGGATLTQYDLGDTMLNLVFDLGGGDARCGLEHGPAERHRRCACGPPRSADRTLRIAGGLTLVKSYGDDARPTTSDRRWLGTAGTTDRPPTDSRSAGGQRNRHGSGEADRKAGV